MKSIETKIPIYYGPYRKVRNQMIPLIDSNIWNMIYLATHSKIFQISHIQVMEPVKDQMEEDLENA
jgi:hypothetical protein